MLHCPTCTCGQDPIPTATAVAAACGITLEDCRTRSKRPELVAPRRRVAVALRSAGYTYRQIGELMDRDPSTMQALIKGKSR